MGDDAENQQQENGSDQAQPTPGDPAPDPGALEAAPANGHAVPIQPPPLSNQDQFTLFLAAVMFTKATGMYSLNDAYVLAKNLIALRQADQAAEAAQAVPQQAPVAT